MYDQIADCHFLGERHLLWRRTCRYPWLPAFRRVGEPTHAMGDSTEAQATEKRNVSFGVMAVLLAQVLMFQWIHQDPEARLQRRSWFEHVSLAIQVRPPPNPPPNPRLCSSASEAAGTQLASGRCAAPVT